MAVSAGLGMEKADARFLKEEDREQIQNDMRDLVKQTVKYFENFDHQYKDSFHNGIADELREFSRVAGAASLKRDVVESTDNTDSLDKQFQDVFSQTLFIGHVQRRSEYLIEYIQALVKTVDSVFIDFPKLVSPKNEALEKKHHAFKEKLFLLSFEKVSGTFSACIAAGKCYHTYDYTYSIAHMKTTTTFTSTISPELIKWVDGIARAKKKTRRAILEEAVRTYKRDLHEESLIEGFKRAANDPDMIELAEWGMSDYARILGSDRS